MVVILVATVTISSDENYAEAEVSSTDGGRITYVNYWQWYKNNAAYERHNVNSETDSLSITESGTYKVTCNFDYVYTYYYYTAEISPGSSGGLWVGSYNKWSQYVVYDSWDVNEDNGSVILGNKKTDYLENCIGWFTSNGAEIDEILSDTQYYYVKWVSKRHTGSNSGTSSSVSNSIYIEYVKPSGRVFIYDNNEWKPAIPWICQGGSVWKRAEARIYNSGSWE